MSVVEETGKDDRIKDGMIKIVKNSETVALEAVSSAGTVIEAGLSTAERLGGKASNVLLGAARRTIEAGRIVGDDIRESAKHAVRDTIQSVADIGSTVKNPSGVAVIGSKDAPKSEKNSEIG